MSNDATAGLEMALTGEAVIEHYKAKRNLALYDIKSTLAYLAKRMEKASLRLEEERGEIILQLEYLSPVLDSLGNCHKNLQEYHRIATDNHEEVRKLKRLKKKLS